MTSLSIWFLNPRFLDHQSSIINHQSSIINIIPIIKSYFTIHFYSHSHNQSTYTYTPHPTFTIKSLAHYFPTATPIQKTIIQPILKGKNVVASALTGSGKTAALVIPMLDRIHQYLLLENAIETSLSNHSFSEYAFFSPDTAPTNFQRAGRPTNAPLALFLTPSFSLADQLHSQIERFSEHLQVQPKIHSISGPNIPNSLKYSIIDHGTDILIGTPGKISSILLTRHHHQTPFFTDLDQRVLEYKTKQLDLLSTDSIYGQSTEDSRREYVESQIETHFEDIAYSPMTPELLAFLSKTSDPRVRDHLNQFIDLGHAKFWGLDEFDKLLGFSSTAEVHTIFNRFTNPRRFRANLGSTRKIIKDYLRSIKNNPNTKKSTLRKYGIISETLNNNPHESSPDGTDDTVPKAVKVYPMLPPDDIYIFQNQTTTLANVNSSDPSTITQSSVHNLHDLGIYLANIDQNEIRESNTHTNTSSTETPTVAVAEVSASDSQIKIKDAESLQFEILQNQVSRLRDLRTFIPLQTCMISATINPQVEDFVQRFVPYHIRVDQNIEWNIPTEIKHIIYRVSHDLKFQLLLYFLNRSGNVGFRGKQVLVFVRTKQRANRLVDFLNDKGNNKKAKGEKAISAVALHGDTPHEARQNIISQFKNNQVRIMVSTGALARGMDFPDLDIMCNLDFPESPSEYVHRVGRVGRAKKAGLAVSFESVQPLKIMIGSTPVEINDAAVLKKIETEIKLERRPKIPGPWEDPTVNVVDPIIEGPPQQFIDRTTSLQEKRHNRVISRWGKSLEPIRAEIDETESFNSSPRRTRSGRLAMGRNPLELSQTAHDSQRFHKVSPYLEKKMKNQYVQSIEKNPDIRSFKQGRFEDAISIFDQHRARKKGIDVDRALKIGNDYSKRRHRQIQETEIKHLESKPRSKTKSRFSQK